MKGVAGFTSIAPDQATDQENWTVKAIGGIEAGITQNEEELDQLFPIGPVLSKLLHAFAAEYYGDNNDKTTQNHDITS